MSSVVSIFKVRVFASDFEFLFGVLVVDIPAQIVLTYCYPLITLQGVNWKIT